MSLNVSAQMQTKLAALTPPATALHNSDFAPTGLSDADGNAINAERTQTDQGIYESSPVDNWILHGPFGGP